jgi:hypothetical protein
VAVGRDGDRRRGGRFDDGGELVGGCHGPFPSTAIPHDNVVWPDRCEREAALLAPRKEPGARPGIGPARVRVADIGCEELDDVATYIEQLQANVSAPSVKQQLAAVRMLFDWLVVGQVVPANPASAVRGPNEVERIRL